MPTTIISENQTDIGAGNELKEVDAVEASWVIIQAAVDVGETGGTDVYLEGRLDPFLDWQNITPPRETTSDPTNIAGRPPWEGLNQGDTIGPTPVRVYGIPEIRVRITNTGSNTSTVSVVVRTAK